MKYDYGIPHFLCICIEVWGPTWYANFKFDSRDVGVCFIWCLAYEVIHFIRQKQALIQLYINFEVPVPCHRMGEPCVGTSCPWNPSRLQGSGAIFVCWVSVKLRLLFTAGPYLQVASARCAVWIFIDLWNLRPQNTCSLSFLRPALKICIKNADFCVNANPAQPLCLWSVHPFCISDVRSIEWRTYGLKRVTFVILCGN